MRRQWPLRNAPFSTERLSCRMSPVTWPVPASSTDFARMVPTILPWTRTPSAFTSPCTAPVSPTVSRRLLMLPSTRPSSWISPSQEISPFTRKSAPMIVGMPALPALVAGSRDPDLLPFRNIACCLQEFAGVYVLAVVDHLIMYMSTGAAASRADQTDHVTARHSLPGIDLNA